MLRSLAAALALAGAALLAQPAAARPGCVVTDTNPCSTLAGPWRSSVAPSPRLHLRSYGGAVVGSRPAGGPRAYCGCAAARYVGLSGAHWNLAANWLRLPRAQPAPGMAAARRGHVKIIVAVLGNGLYRFYDPNSGGGLTRITTGTLAGYAVVNPRGHYLSARRRLR